MIHVRVKDTPVLTRFGCNVVTCDSKKSINLFGASEEVRALFNGLWILSIAGEVDCEPNGRGVD